MGGTSRLLVVSQLPPPVHGVTVMTSVLLRAFDRLRIHAELMPKNLSYSAGEIGKLTATKVGRIVSFLLRLTWASLRHRSGVAVFFLTATRMSLLLDGAAIRILRAFRIQVITYLHGIGLKEAASHSARMRRIIQRILFSSVRVVVLGQNAAFDIRGLVEGSRVIAVPNALPDESMGALKPGVSADGSVTFLFLATLDRTKGAIEFVRAAALLASRVREARFILAGQSVDDRVTGELKDAISAAGLDSRTQFAGSLYGAEKRAAFSAADVFVFPTRYPQENFPLVNLEAMLAGLPVISSDRGCIREQVLHGATGFVINPDDATELASRMEELARDPNLRTCMGAEGRARYLREFSFERFCDRWGDVLNGVARERADEERAVRK